MQDYSKRNLCDGSTLKLYRVGVDPNWVKFNASKTRNITKFDEQIHKKTFRALKPDPKKENPPPPFHS